MYFKRLELFGFKSFAGKTRLDFEPGITAVVGPNGCGKSNIADSIKWVLGEQSAKILRGSRMEDVIFNGTDGKEPVNYAEVSLTLSNQDRILPIEYDEVTITRRLYRSGESEYLLNRTPVRLKDINELFMGTGIGTSSYSLIEQGRIDQVLSLKPDDRREVFEEASGITKYKSKKKEALRKLEDTEQNLTRLNDIIQEVKRQINSIERQAKKAERYKEKYEELKEQELELSRLELEILKQKLTEFNGNLGEFNTRESELNSELQKVTDEISGLNTEKSRIETKKMDFKSSVIELNSEISKSKDKLSLNKERIEELKKKCVDLGLEIEKNEGNSLSQEREVTNLKEKLAVLETDRDKRSGILSDREERLDRITKDIVECETNISTSKANVIDIAAKQSKLRNQYARISTTLNTHDARLKRLKIESGTIQGEKDQLDTKISGITKEIESLDTELSSLKVERDEVAERLSNLARNIEKLVDQSTEIHRTLAANKSRLEVLEEARAKYEGFSSGVKAILNKDNYEDQRIIDGVKDVLANLLSVKKGYEKAMESALGESLEAIVVDTMSSAEEAINFLKENSYGKASFIHPASFNETASQKTESMDFGDARILGRAIDFVDMNEDYANMVRHFLEGVVIVKDLGDALSVLKENAALKENILVTLLGEVVRKGFVSAGDTQNVDVTLINREARIKELIEAIFGLENDSRRIEEERLNDEKEKGLLEIRLNESDEVLNEKAILLANAKSRRSNIEENMKGIIDEISLVNLEIDEVKAEEEKLRQELESIKNELTGIERDAFLNEENIKTNEDRLSEYTKEKEKLLIEIAEQRTELGSLESKNEGFSNTLKILESALKDSQGALQSRKDDVESSASKIEGLDTDILDLQRNITLLSEESVKKSQELDMVVEEYGQVMREIEERECVFNQSEEALNKIKSSLHGEDLKKVETNYSIDNLRQRIKDVYKVALDDVQMSEQWKDIEREELKKELEEKRAKLDSMGPVNLVAIEEHTELQERYAFLTNQQDDLLKAKDALLKVIAKINKTTKELFIETFRNIQVEFKNFFKILFGGGDGEIVLLDESNVLESGIEIIARPPGKRLQNVSLLSGGERALTAISLIFAIFKVKPSPFCVLDEIDAPLDESNVDRFSRSLEGFTNTSQFIVITHNKKTIDMADVMYGITMQESGISKVVS
ncbi:MAG: chromosome segregation protein SMC, partial [Candidatus Omnitrophica bacterium]|nr:chromosome segregation protein SMC [Candidatus Omnitrophota bacterium]